MEEDSVLGQERFSASSSGSFFHLFLTQSIQVSSYNSVLRKVYDFRVHAEIPSPPYSQTHPTRYLNLSSMLAPQFRPSLLLAKSEEDQATGSVISWGQDPLG